MVKSRRHKGWVLQGSSKRPIWLPQGKQWADPSIRGYRSTYWIGVHGTGFGPFKTFAAAAAAWTTMYGIPNYEKRNTK